MKLISLISQIEKEPSERLEKELDEQLKKTKNRSLYAMMTGPYIDTPWGVIRKFRWRELSTVRDIRTRTEAKEELKQAYKTAKTYKIRKKIGKILGGDRTNVIRNMLRYGYGLHKEELYELWVHGYSPKTGEKLPPLIPYKNPPRIEKAKKSLKRFLRNLKYELKRRFT
jgi:hypothetical protein